MSTGMWFGGVVGGVVGLMIGGPVGAYYGATIGMGIGALIDPIQPDISSPGQPELGNLNISTANEGIPIKDMLGTVKISQGNIIWYCCERVVQVTEEVEGGKGGGGSQQVTTGYKYYASWALGLCMGEVDTLCTIYNGDDVVWYGELNRPVSGGEETITLTGMGSATFYFGTDDQAANATIGSNIADPTLNTPYRHLCWVFFNDCYIGPTERIPTMKFVLRKTPTFAFNANKIIQTYDYNPAHAQYYILNDMLEISTDYLNATAFSSVADTLYSENLGISMLFNSQNAAITYIESVLAHTDSIIRWGNDGKFHPKLIRADEDEGNLLSFDENDLLDDLEIERRSWYDTLNEVKVQYTEMIGRELDPPPCEDIYKVMTSPNGFDWTPRLCCSRSWQSVCWSPDLSLLVAVANSGTSKRVMTSSDGINWIARTTPANNSWESVCWSPDLNLFVAVAKDGAQRVMTSPNGKIWTARTTPLASWQSVCWSPELGIFAAVSGVTGGTGAMTSSDGINWVSRITPSSNSWRSIAWSPEQGIFAAVGYTGPWKQKAMSSTDGITWTANSQTYDRSWNSVVWSNDGIFVAVANDNSTYQVMTSANGTSWTCQNVWKGLLWTHVCWKPSTSLFLALSTNEIGGTHNRIMTCPDGGITWTARDIPDGTEHMDIYSCCWSPALSMFVIVGSSY